ncbi:prepilin-type N-terminal cleavage/methylation domain-containing protein [Pseudaeromonas pectinilytica]
MRSINGLRGAGFTLIELVMGIVLIAIALGGMLGLLINQSAESTEPVQQVRAAQLAQRLLNDISARSFDQNSDHNGSHWRCGETVNGITYATCTLPTGYGPDPGETKPYLFNDVDDYHTPAICSQDLTSCSDSSWVAASYFTDNSVATQNDYPNYRVQIVVTPGPGCSATGCSTVKLITVTVQLPDGSQLPFALLRGNY